MNTTDILFNTGQWNWDAISTISNSILVAALVFITWRYARQVRKQTILMEKDRMKNKILEEIQDVLTPTIYSLEKEIEAIKKNEIFWYKSREEGIFVELFKIYGNSGAFKDVFGKFPDLEEMFLSHDNLYGKLNELYTEIEREIRTPELKERLKNLVNTFNQSREEAYKLRWVSDIERKFENHIINKKDPKRSPNTIEPHIDFWEEYRDKLLEFRNTPRVKELDKEIGNRLTQLKELDSDLLEKIKEKREKYREEYHFTKYEIDPQLEKLEEWLGMRT
ncbi:hypothetical protein C5S32_09190 [ANME-1 cluster archaeon GoMg1]|nr:hypothetical protein [ANME-1 cluster archaeon GoMg1]